MQRLNETDEEDKDEEQDQEDDDQHEPKDRHGRNANEQNTGDSCPPADCFRIGTLPQWHNREGPYYQRFIDLGVST